MFIATPLYRARQFFTALLAQVDAEEIEEAASTAQLSAEAASIFRRLPRHYQRHALNVYHRVYAEGGRDPSLLTAALLHDIGKWDPKSGRRVWLFVSVAATLLRRVGPGRRILTALGRRKPPVQWWRMSFVLQQHHAALGAAIVSNAGADTDTVLLIKWHERPASNAPDHLHDRLLALQAADDME